MYIPNTTIGIQYASTSIPINISKKAKEYAFNGASSDNDLILAFMHEVVNYAKEKYAGTSTLIELETYLMSLYAPFYDTINNDVLIVDGEPVTFDPIKEEIVFIR